MRINIEEKLDKEIKNASKTLGVDKNQVIERAILFYLENIKKTLNLKKEFEAWDLLSNEALLKMEHEKR